MIRKLSKEASFALTFIATVRLPGSAQAIHCATGSTGTAHGSGSFRQNTLSLPRLWTILSFPMFASDPSALWSVLRVSLWEFAWSCFLPGLARGMSSDLQRRAANVRAEILFTRPGSMQLTGSTANLSTKYVDLLKQVDGVEDALPVVVYVLQGNRGFGFERIEGVEWEHYARVNDLQIESGRAPQANDEIIVDVTKARNNQSVGGNRAEAAG